jgi:aminobenzoyl-glutamate utilization protein B
LNGGILVIGCPAEEILWGKIALLRVGAFENIDVLLTSHGDYQNGALSRPCQSVISGEFVFLGESGHAGSVRRQNALDAAELAVQSIERLRAHHFPETAVEHILRVGGHIPNVTPDEARLWVTSRQLNFERAREVYHFVRSVAAQSAEVCGVTFKEQFIAGTRGYLPNDALAQVLQQQLDSLGPPRWTAEDINWMSSLCKAIKPNEPMRLDRSLALYSDGHDAYAQDDGEVSWRVPLGRVNWAIPEQVPLHNWAYTALSGHPSSYAGPLMASEALALAAVQVAVEPNIILDAKSELRQRTANIELGEPMLGAWRTLTKTPEAFWDGTWNEI